MTGRTHQIRLHLQLIGLPIANDPCYGGILHYGEPPQPHSSAPTPTAPAPTTAPAPAAPTPTPISEPSPTREPDVNHSFDLPQQPNETDDAFILRTCQTCRRDVVVNENKLHCARIWLHALHYEVSIK